MNPLHTAPLNFILFQILHFIAFMGIALGVLFLLIWAYQTFKPEQFKQWGIKLLAIGIVACVVGASLLAFAKPWKGDRVLHEDRMDQDVMDDHMMMDGDEADHMSMSMNDMSAMLEGKTGDAFDKAFLEGMIVHHQGAIDMANQTLISAGHDELKQMARTIIEAQQREIDQMKAWQVAWSL